ncbi:hypothetical protein A2U01_0083576, partial [Trifolium medium]|nr:hypothetical protein [Trifolium medium]
SAQIAASDEGYESAGALTVTTYKLGTREELGHGFQVLLSHVS